VVRQPHVGEVYEDPHRGRYVVGGLVYRHCLLVTSVQYDQLRQGLVVSGDWFQSIAGEPWTFKGNMTCRADELRDGPTTPEAVGLDRQLLLG
jgi:hypothetical protein